MTAQTWDEKLEKLKREVRRSIKRQGQPLQTVFPPKARRGDTLTAAVLGLLKVIAIVTIPFIVLVRGSVYLYASAGAPSWLAITIAALLTCGIVALYAAWLSRRFRGRARASNVWRWTALPLVIAWCVYALFYLASANAKSTEVRSYFRSLHPVLRVAVSTVILVDPELVITDMQRVAADYGRMGLPVNDRTRHYVQADGWVHAMDLRTRGRSEIKNRLVQFYFWTMGFSTLRHVGNADHLHVQLRSR